MSVSIVVVEFVERKIEAEEKWSANTRDAIMMRKIDETACRIKENSTLLQWLKIYKQESPDLSVRLPIHQNLK